MELEQFEKALKEDDFSVGDSFWLGDWEFEVVNKERGLSASKHDMVFKWTLDREEFIQVVRDNHPEIKNPEEFFNKHKDDILYDFTKAFDVLVSECGATYGTVINDVIDEVIARTTNSISFCKEVDEKWMKKYKKRLMRMWSFFEQLKSRVFSEQAVVVLISEIGRDIRMEKIKQEREANNSSPATERQKRFMDDLGITYPKKVTKQEASVLIDEELGKNNG